MKRIRNWILIAALVGATGSWGHCAGLESADGVFGPLSALSVSQPQLDPSVPSKWTCEDHAGNGTGAGYILSHGSIIPGSEIVSVGGSSKRKDKDYRIDYSSGTLVFTEPVRPGLGIRVSYRYAESDKGERTIVALPGLSILNSDTLSMNLTYAYRAAGKETGAPDIMTYGVQTTTKLGASSSLTSMMYMASPQKGSSVVSDSEQQKAPEIKSDQVSVHNADVNFGSLNLKLGIQDVGKDFAGFQALKDTKAAPADVLAQLEKEKGLKRYSASGALGLTKSLSISGGVDTLKDDDGEIDNRSFGVTSSWMKASFNVREIDSTFGRFKDIKEADRAQLAKEKGIKRTGLAMELAPFGRPKDSTWNSLRMDQIEDASGSIDTRSINIDTGKVSFSAYNRKVDEEFARINDISGQERTDFALAIRQQFDPNAKAAQVTDKDRAQISKELGIERTNYRGGLKLGSLTTSFQQFAVTDKTGEIERQSAEFSGSNFKVFAMHQSIDKDFGRMADLAEVERQQFGNEVGMDRLGYGGSFNFGSVASSLSFSKVEDTETGAEVQKRGVNLSGTRFNISANYQEIDPEFNRVKDLSDADKKRMQNEIGYRRWDITSGLKITPSLSLDSYYYDAENESEKKGRTQLRNKLTYNPTSGPKVMAFRDSFSFESEETGNVSNYLHEIYTLAHNIGPLGFNIHREKKEVQEGENDPVTVTINSEHITTDVKKKTWLAADHKSVDLGDGRHEKTQGYRLQSSPIKGMNLSHSFVGIQREEGRPDEETRTYALQWGITKNLNAMADVARKSTSEGQVTEKKAYGLAGQLAERFLFMKDVKVSASVSQEKQDAQVLKEAEAYKLDSVVAKGNLALEYTAGRNKEGVHPVSKSYRFTSDRSNKRLLFDVLYKDRLDNANAQYLVRSYNVGLKLNERTQLTYGYFSNVEKDKGRVDPVKGEALKFSTVISNGLKLAFDYKMDENMLTGAEAERYGLGLTGQLPGGQLIEIFYGIDDLLGKDIDSVTHTYRLKFENQISAEHFLTFTGRYARTDNKAGEDKEDVDVRVDFRTLFG